MGKEFHNGKFVVLKLRRQFSSQALDQDHKQKKSMEEPLDFGEHFVALMNGSSSTTTGVDEPRLNHSAHKQRPSNLIQTPIVTQTGGHSRYVGYFQLQPTVTN